MTDNRSPRWKPRAARPCARSRTWSWYSRQLQVCQIPRSFSRTAGRFARSRALRCSRRGSVDTSATLTSIAHALGVAQVRLDHLRVRPHLVGTALRLVEEQDLGVKGEGPAQLDALLEAVGQRAGRPSTQVLDAEEIDDVLHSPPVGHLLPLGEPPVDEGGEHARLHAD